MSRGRGFSRGGSRGGGRGGFQRDMGPPDQVLGRHYHPIPVTAANLHLATELGSFVHAVEDEMLCSSAIMDKVPYFNAPVYLQNKSVIGKVDEILGPINEVYFSVKMGEGMIATSFKKGDKVYIGGDKLLPIERFLPKPKTSGGVTKRGRNTRVLPFGRGGRGANATRGFQRGGGRGAGRGGFRGGFREQHRGATRGGFSSRGNRGAGGGIWNSRGGGQGGFKAS